MSAVLYNVVAVLVGVAVLAAGVFSIARSEGYDRAETAGLALAVTALAVACGAIWPVVAALGVGTAAVWAAAMLVRRQMRVRLRRR